jgi:hypothetical protein
LRKEKTSQQASSASLCAAANDALADCGRGLNRAGTDSARTNAALLGLLSDIVLSEDTDDCLRPSALLSAGRGVSTRHTGCQK